MSKQAWFCPSCQKHHAPHVDTCPAPVDLISKPLPTMPVYPIPGSSGDVPRLPWVSPTTCGTLPVKGDPNLWVCN